MSEIELIHSFNCGGRVCELFYFLCLNKEDGSLNVNPNSLTKVTAYVEPALMEAKGYDSFQFVRTGFFCADIHDSKEGAPVFNRIVSLKSSFKLPKA